MCNKIGKRLSYAQLCVSHGKPSGGLKCFAFDLIKPAFVGSVDLGSIGDSRLMG